MFVKQAGTLTVALGIKTFCFQCHYAARHYVEYLYADCRVFYHYAGVVVPFKDLPTSRKDEMKYSR